jgi:O-antigen ligase
MPPAIASLIYVCGIAGLFYLDRDKSIKTSKALWLPVLYLWILGSRPLSYWLGAGPSDAYGANVQLEGSPIDAIFFQVLLVAAIVVLSRRGQKLFAFINANAPILIYFFYCLLSICWSDYPGVAIKRWIKAVGDVAMVLIVLTDDQPVAALRRLFSRTAFILLPLSLLYIKYYPALGRSYDQWTGAQMNNGITYDKNILGVVTFVLLLGAVWRILGLLWPNEAIPDRRRHLLAQGALLVLGISLLMTANSATSLVCFLLGAGLMVTTRLGFIRRHPAAVHTLVVFLIISAGSLMWLGGGAHAARALGRNPTLTGRTEIWATVIPLASNPVVGAGFESFWLSPRVHQQLWAAIPGLPLNEAHNGYIEMYLELGWMGVGLLCLLLIDGYRRSVKAFRRDPQLGGLLIAYVLTATVYSITEAGFRMMFPMWFFLLLAVIEASGIAAGAGITASRSSEGPDVRATRLPTRNRVAMRPIR